MTREELKRAFDEAMDYDFAFLENMPEHEFSASFERKMRKIFRRANRKSDIFNMTTSKKFFAMAASFIIVCICTMQVDAISEPIIKFINTVYDKFNLITFNNHSTLDYITCEYKLTYIPNGFSLTNRHISPSIISTEYTNESNNLIKLVQNIIMYDGHGYLDNEQGTIKTQILSDTEILIYSSDDCIIANWVQDNYNMILSCIGDFNESEVIKMIESVRAVEPDASAATPDMTTAE
ncbi:MAG: DUF4367 domain-containing protein [Lachnospiraceae bacterium]|nr:DUF4367 domain-containing protein [Lachnospiraceae bacterium]